MGGPAARGRRVVSPGDRGDDGYRPMIASVEGVVGAVAADSLVIEVGGIGYRVFVAPAVLASAQPGKVLKLHTHHLVREDLQALYGFRSVEELGFFNLLLTVNGVGPKVALAIVGSRPDPRPAARDHDRRSGGAGEHPGDRQEARGTGDLRAEGEGHRGRCVGGGTVCARAAAASEGEIVAALQALGYSLSEAREASRIALADVGVESTLEERVKAALRSLLRE